MEYKSDTIVAISTPPGIGGIAVIRISGEDAIAAVAPFFRGKKISSLPTHKATFGKIADKNMDVDEVVLTIFRAPQSYTGEDVVEISCHGSNFIARKILQLILQKARLADPGEFTKRAFLNNKMGLTQAEAVGDLLNAKTKYSHLAALQQLEGKLHSKISGYLKILTDLRAKLELEIDFMEQGLEELERENFLLQIKKLQKDLGDLVETGEEGLILKEGYKICLVGAPNVGKSSIFNAFLESERAIVTPVPGTTRDYLEEAVSLKGYLLKIYDTAGLRKTKNSVEKMGIKRSYELIRNSHKILFIIDGKKNEDELKKLKKLVPKEHILKILNKCDLLSENTKQKFTKQGYIPCSATSKNGLKDLKKRILQEIEISPDILNEGILNNPRQIAAATKAYDALDTA
ncbi:MAG: tRNA uridine-5-carboxymethylaminomethyl(34) synthesis GTPase MnmE, partial [Candidatus Cloacimonadota bacterium]|nr:tRNA uridine-5-carboxymethylaminomethyl(34) synthesis GTPase MnmE [Candidatus Cloacimonadota bacterium]